MFKIVALALLSVAYAAYYEESAARLVAEVNSQQSSWQAGYNPYFAGMSLEQIKAKMGAKLGPRPGPEKLVTVSAGLDPSFDARTKWPNCPNIGFIRDQANCGSCWAVSAGEVVTDRTCIATNTQYYLSDEDILSCCTGQDQGCDGGYPIDAMAYWQTSGVVTGGPFGSNQGCQPYAIAPCPPQGCNSDAKTPKCSKNCIAGYNTAYAADKHYASSHYAVKGGAVGIQTELSNNGPVEAAFSVYEDFMHYTSGVYHHTSGGFLGGHAVKIIGWGSDTSNTPYWLVANSWNTTWGMSGFFMIRRGNNECGFESGVVAGMAKN